MAKELTVKDLLEKDILKNLNAEIKKLESRKFSLDSEIAQKEEQLNHYKASIEQEIERKREELSARIQEENQKIREKEKDLARREKDIVEREKELKEIDEQFKKLQQAKKDFLKEQETLEGLKAGYTEREHKANLLIEQYTKKLKELG